MVAFDLRHRKSHLSWSWWIFHFSLLAFAFSILKVLLITFDWSPIYLLFCLFYVYSLSLSLSRFLFLFSCNKNCVCFMTTHKYNNNKNINANIVLKIFRRAERYISLHFSERRNLSFNWSRNRQMFQWGIEFSSRIFFSSEHLGNSIIRLMDEQKFISDWNKIFFSISLMP